MVLKHKKGVVFIDLPLAITVEIDLSPLNSRPAQVKAVMHRESKVWPPEGLVAIRLRSSIKAQSKGNNSIVSGILRDPCIEYSSMMFMPVRRYGIWWKKKKNSYGHWIV